MDGSEALTLCLPAHSLYSSSSRDEVEKASNVESGGLGLSSASVTNCQTDVQEGSLSEPQLSHLQNGYSFSPNLIELL